MACDAARRAASTCPATAVRNPPQNRMGHNIGRRFPLYGAVSFLNYWGASSYLGMCVQLMVVGCSVRVIIARETDMQHVPQWMPEFNLVEKVLLHDPQQWWPWPHQSLIFFFTDAWNIKTFSIFFQLYEKFAWWTLGKRCSTIAPLLEEVQIFESMCQRWGKSDKGMILMASF